MDEYNNAAFDNYNEKALVPCPNCGRTFLPDSLVKHRKACDKLSGKSGASPARGGMAGGSSPMKSGGISKPSMAQEKSPPRMVEPKSVICYICGRKYGTASIEIHLKACEKKWDIEQQKLPPKERRPCPTKPVVFDQALTGVK